MSVKLFFPLFLFLGFQANAEVVAFSCSNESFSSTLGRFSAQGTLQVDDSNAVNASVFLTTLASGVSKAKSGISQTFDLTGTKESFVAGEYLYVDADVYRLTGQNQETNLGGTFIIAKGASVASTVLLNGVSYRSICKAE